MRVDFTNDKFKVTIPEGSISHRIESQLIPITEEMNRSPLRVNKETWERNYAKISDEVEKAVSKCRQATGLKDFRPNARQDCMKYFYESAGYIPMRKTPSGEPTMDVEALNAIADQGDPVAPQVIEARQLMSKQSQLKSWGVYANAGQVQATWDQFGTPMARYTAEEPNLQNRILEIRETCEPREGYTLISWDLGMAEYVTWASLSKDPVLTEIFVTGRDIHTEMSQVILDAVPSFDFRGDTPRQYGKMVNFALCYLMNDWSLSKRLGCTPQVAMKIIESYKRRASRAVEYQTSVIEAARKSHKVTTFFGRERILPMLGSPSKGARDEAIKTAWHHKNAGTAAEILKIKQSRTLAAMAKLGLYPGIANCVLQMHDEIVLEVRNDRLDEAKEAGTEAFQRSIPGFLDFQIVCRTGANWLQTSK